MNRKHPAFKVDQNVRRTPARMLRDERLSPSALAYDAVGDVVEAGSARIPGDEGVHSAGVEIGEIVVVQRGDQAEDRVGAAERKGCQVPVAQGGVRADVDSSPGVEQRPGLDLLAQKNPGEFRVIAGSKNERIQIDTVSMAKGVDL